MARGSRADKGDGSGKGKRHRVGWVAAILGVVAALLAAGGALYVATSRGAATATVTATPPPPPKALQVVETSPSSGATGVAPDALITVTLSTALSTSSPMPTLSPPLAGTWTPVSSTVLEFFATAPLVPGTQETLTVPGGATGLLGARGQYLAATTTTSFTVAPGSTLRLQQLLAQLGYLPVSFTATGAPSAPQQEADPQAGTFTWRWANQPAQLTALWSPGTDNVITRGAVMDFEAQHNLTTDGVAGPQVWAALLQAAAAGTADAQPYDYVLVSTQLPETATVYRNGAVAYHTLANTGVSAAPTALGTFPVYLRYRVTTMSGTNPNGSHYSDPGIPWVSYFNGGDALHGFVRASYGFPQSVGCVEMPPANAAVVWPMTPIGTLVTVS